MAYYVAPLCFMYGDPALLYLSFRELYVRYFSQLHTVSSGPQNLLRLARMFERLLATHQPDLVMHLHQLGIVPLAMALPWMARAFAGFLPPEQVLVLWDRIIGFDSLELLPMLAAAVFLFHERALLQAADAEDARHVLHDASELKVVPLLQAFLFASDRLRDL